MKQRGKESFSIIHEERHLLIIHKPAGYTTQPEAVEWARRWLQEKYKKENLPFLHPVHRLDKPVSGLLLCARSSKALSRLHAMMRKREITRVYHAWVENPPPHPEGRAIHHLTHSSFRSLLDENGKEAILEYKVIDTIPSIGWKLEIQLITGRYHQIRAQLAALGCPILGDQLYGSRKTWPIGIALSHVKIQFQNPISDQTEIVIFNSALDFFL